MLQRRIKFKRCSAVQFNISLFESTMSRLIFREIKSLDDFQIPFNFNFNHAASLNLRDESEEERKY